MPQTPNAKPPIQNPQETGLLHLGVGTQDEIIAEPQNQKTLIPETPTLKLGRAVRETSYEIGETEGGLVHELYTVLRWMLAAYLWEMPHLPFLALQGSCSDTSFRGHRVLSFSVRPNRSTPKTPKDQISPKTPKPQKPKTPQSPNPQTPPPKALNPLKPLIPQTSQSPKNLKPLKPYFKPETLPISHGQKYTGLGFRV